MSAHHRAADCDQVHDFLDGVSEVANLTPEEAEVAAILGWPVTAYRSGPRARLTVSQREVLAELIAWRRRGAPAIPVPRPPAEQDDRTCAT